VRSRRILATAAVVALTQVPFGAKAYPNHRRTAQTVCRMLGAAVQAYELSDRDHACPTLAELQRQSYLSSSVEGDWSISCSSRRIDGVVRVPSEGCGFSPGTGVSVACEY